MTRIYLFIFFGLIIRLLVYYHNQEIFHAGENIEIIDDIKSQPTKQNGKQIIYLTKLSAYIDVFPSYHYNDRIKISGTVICPKKQLTCSHGYIKNGKIILVSKKSFNIWLDLALKTRNLIENTYKNLFNFNQANLLSGIVLGGSKLDSNFKDKLANIGLTHIVAASGMNVSFVSGILLSLLALLHLSKKGIVIFGSITILFYCTITGFEPPIVRAAIMAISVLAASTLGRKSSAISGLALSAFLMLWVEPNLITSVSFLLSFTAMTGQIYLSTKISKLTNLFKSLAEYFLPTPIAIIFTFPILVSFFGQFSLISIFTNFLVLWTIGPLMILGFLAGILGSISINMGQLIALPTSVLLNYFLLVVDIFSKNKDFLLKIPQFDITFIFGYYLVLAGLILWTKEDILAL